MSAPPRSEAGLTLVELLAALTIVVIVAIPLLGMLKMTLNTWRSTISDEHLHAALARLDQRLEQIIPNLQDANVAHGVLTGTSLNGDTIAVFVTTSDNSTQGIPDGAVVIQDQTSGTETVIVEPYVSFAGTSFTVDGSVVNCLLTAQSLAAPKVVLQEPATYVMNGGV
jgi:Tfp pilus assembly protein PilV